MSSGSLFDLPKGTQRGHRRFNILALSLCGWILSIAYLISPVLLLPAEPQFAELTTGIGSVEFEGNTVIPIVGLHLLLYIVFSSVWLVIPGAAVVASLLLVPATAWFANRRLLLSLLVALTLFLIGILLVWGMFEPYAHLPAFGAGVMGVVSMIIALWFRMQELSEVLEPVPEETV